ncbi:MAG: hypothetical protein GX657_01120, partial [Chloroflexi bacterium]|nr:hypothetical protein [Chloroflexota bacterium]
MAPRGYAISPYYDAGLEGGGHTGWSEEIGLRLLAVDPYWYGPEEAAALDPSESLAVSSVVARGPEGWDALNGGLILTAGMMDNCWLAEAPNGDLLAGGRFDQDAFGNPIANVARWNGSAWAPLSADEPNLLVTELVVDADGNVYIGGQFSAIGAAPFGRVAMWDGSAWHNLDGGMDLTVNCLAVGPDGSVYAGGAFTTAGGSPAARVARWDGSSWHAMGAGFPDVVTSLAIAPDGSVYAGGWFTKAGGAVADYFACWNGVAWEGLGQDVEGVIQAITIGPNGDLYAGGAIDAPNVLIGRWDGSAWHRLGAGVNGSVYALTFGPDGNLYVGGRFTSAGGLALAQRAAIWNGYSWLPLDINLPGDPRVSGVSYIGDTLYLGFDTSGTALTSGYTTVTNPG